MLARKRPGKSGGTALSEKELEALARYVYRAYAALPEADGKQVDPELLAGKLLGLRVVYRRLSRDGSILGITAPAAVGVPVLEGDGMGWFFLDGRTILLEERLLGPWASRGRRRFTLMHEVGHRLLGFVQNGPDEAQANRLASALLMPEALLGRYLRALGWTPGPVPDRRLDPERYRTFTALAEAMGVSRQALAIRLEQLGLTGQRKGWTLRPVPVLTTGEGETEG